MDIFWCKSVTNNRACFYVCWVVLTLTTASARRQIRPPEWIFQEALGLFAQVGHSAPENEWHCVYLCRQTEQSLTSPDIYRKEPHIPAPAREKS